MQRADGHPRIANRPAVLVVESVAFAVLVAYAIGTGRVAWWALAVAIPGFVVGVAYARGYRPLGRHTRAILALALVMLIVVGCAPGPVYTAAPGPGIPPEVHGIRFVHEGEDMECGIGLVQNGVVAGLVSVFAPPAGFLPWAAWTVTDGDGLRATLQECWDTSQSNWREIELMTQCWGQPTVTTTWTDWGAATQWVKMPFCQCNQTCQREAWLSAAGWAQVQNWCRQVLNQFFCTGFGHANAAANAVETETTLPAAGTDEPLPPGFSPPAWDVNAPAPEHPVNCALPDCSDLLPG